MSDFDMLRAYVKSPNNVDREEAAQALDRIEAVLRDARIELVNQRRLVVDALRLVVDALNARDEVEAELTQLREAAREAARALEEVSLNVGGVWESDAAADAWVALRAALTQENPDDVTPDPYA